MSATALGEIDLGQLFLGLIEALRGGDITPGLLLSSSRAFSGFFVRLVVGDPQAPPFMSVSSIP